MRAIPLLISLMIPATASATQVVALDLDQMVDRADVVVLGTVADVRSERVPEARGRIHTLVTVTVAEPLLTDSGPSQTITFTVPGGRLGRIGQLVPGAPTFQVGSEVLVLLARHDTTKRLRLVGLAQGRYQVERAPSTPPALVSDRGGLGLVVRDPRGRMVPAPASQHLERRPLGATLELIRKRVKIRR